MRFEKLDKETRELLKEILEHEDHLTEFLDGKFENLSYKDDSRLRGQISCLIDNSMLQVQWADNVPYLTNILHAGRIYFEKEAEYLKEQELQQSSTTYNIQNASQSIIGSQQNATVNAQCNSYEDLERLIFEKGGDDKAELFALANEIKEILESIQRNTQLPQKKGLFAKLSDHASKHGWFYGAVLQLVGTVFMQMYFK